MNAGKIIMGALSIALAYYYGMVQPDSASHPNAPEGALEYFENGDGSQYVTLFKDSLIVGDEKEDVEVEIPFTRIRSVKTMGVYLTVNGNDGEKLKLNMPSPAAADRVEEKIKELLPG